MSKEGNDFDLTVPPNLAKQEEASEGSSADVEGTHSETGRVLKTGKLKGLLCFGQLQPEKHITTTVVKTCWKDTRAI